MGDLVTEQPHANFCLKAFEASLSLTPNRSSPDTMVIIFFLLRVLVSITTCAKQCAKGVQITSCWEVQSPSAQNPVPSFLFYTQNLNESDLLFIKQFRHQACKPRPGIRAGGPPPLQLDPLEASASS